MPADRGPQHVQRPRGMSLSGWGGMQGGAGAAAGEMGRASQVSVGLRSPLYSTGDLEATGRLPLLIFLTSKD